MTSTTTTHTPTPTVRVIARAKTHLPVGCAGRAFTATPETFEASASEVDALWAKRTELEITWPDTWIAPDGSQPGRKPTSAEKASEALTAKLAATTDELTKARADLKAANRALEVARADLAAANGRAALEAKEREQANRRHLQELAAVHERYERDLEIVRAQHGATSEA